MNCNLDISLTNMTIASHSVAVFLQDLITEESSLTDRHDSGRIDQKQNSLGPLSTFDCNQIITICAKYSISFTYSQQVITLTSICKLFNLISAWSQTR